MRFGGVLPPDAPDPRLQRIESAKAMPVPILGFVPQRHLEDWGALGVSTTGAGILDQMEVEISYTLWRNPDDRDDPANRADLDERTRASLAEEPPWPRPQWLLDAVARMRYQSLPDAVRTTWHRERREDSTVDNVLVHHVNGILRNHFRRELGRGERPWGDDRAFEVSTSHVQRHVPVEVAGVPVDGIRIDTDPFVFGVGADLGAGGILTAVIPRDELPFVRIAFAERPLE